MGATIPLHLLITLPAEPGTALARCTAAWGDLHQALAVSVFQSTCVGRNDFPKTLPDFLLQQWLTLGARDRRSIRKAFRSRQWIGAALQLGFLGMTGTTLRSLEYVPAAVLHNVSRLEIDHRTVVRRSTPSPFSGQRKIDPSFDRRSRGFQLLCATKLRGHKRQPQIASEAIRDTGSHRHIVVYQHWFDA